jgi:hypothetical protein
MDGEVQGLWQITIHLWVDKGTGEWKFTCMQGNNILISTDMVS